MPTLNNCLRYWDLADHIRINDAIALWCGAYSTRNWTTIPRGSGQRFHDNLDTH
jgi:hypothetical protein